MRILQRYVLNDLTRVFALIISVLTIMLVGIGVAGEASKNGLGMEQIIKIIPYIVPSLLPYTIPATFLLTVCIVYGRMAGDNEVTAIKAAGINAMAVLIPSFALGAVLSLGTFILTDQFIPWGRENIENVVTQAMEDIFLDLLRTKSEYHDAPHGISIMVSAVGPRRAPGDRPKLIRPIFRYRLATGEVVTISAREATIRFNLEEQEIELTLNDAEMEMPTGGYAKIPQERRTFPLPAATDSRQAPRNMTIASIRKEMVALSRERRLISEKQMVGAVIAMTTGEFSKLAENDPAAATRQEAERRERYNKLRTEIHGRISLSCSCIFFVLLGSPFSILYGRRQVLTNFALCFGPILAVYYPLVLVSMNLCRGGVINPIWGMWLANVTLAVLAMIVLRKVLRH